MAGRCRIAGTPQVRPCRLGSRLLVCAFLRTRQDRGWASCPARPRHASGPCRGHPAIRHRPTSDSFPVADGSTPCADAVLSIVEIFDFDGDSSTHGVDLRVDQGRHPPRAGHAIPRVLGNLSKAGWVRLRGCPRHGCRGQAYKDVFTASPATGPTPPSHGMPAFAFALPSIRQVQGAALPNPYRPSTRAIASTSSSPVTGLRRKPPMPAASTCCCRSGSVRAVTASSGSV